MHELAKNLSQASLKRSTAHLANWVDQGKSIQLVTIRSV